MSRALQLNPAISNSKGKQKMYKLWLADFKIAQSKGKWFQIKFQIKFRSKEEFKITEFKKGGQTVIYKVAFEMKE